MAGRAAWALLLLFSLGIIAPAAAETAAEKAQRETQLEAAKREQMKVDIRCVEVRDRQWTWRLGDHDEEAYAPSDIVKTRDKVRKKLKAECNSPTYSNAVLTLVGSGRIALYVNRTKYESAARLAQKDGHRIRLYLNGFDQGAGAELVSAEPAATGDLMVLLFSVKRGADNKNLWTALYQEGGMEASVPLRVGLGWSDVGQLEQAGNWDNRIAITDDASVKVAAAMILALLIAFWSVLKTTDAMRDAPTEWYWSLASSLRARLNSRPFKFENSGLDIEAQRKKVLDGCVPGFVYMSTDGDDYGDAAESALLGEKPGAARLGCVIAGLCIRQRRWTGVKATYSLGRVQMGVWLVFAVSTSLFLWAIFGQLSVLPSSLVALLTLSAATAGASVKCSNSVPNK